MKLSEFSIAIGVVVAITATGLAQAPRGKDLEKPLVIAKQGSFFVGGEKMTLPAAPAASGRGGGPDGEITINQMYAQYQIPANGNRHVPVVMVHGCCLSSKATGPTPLPPANAT
jgi:hypothetical protein